MRTSKVIHVVSCHAEGEVGDVIVGGVAPPPGETLWEQSRWIAQDETLRNFLLNEPRGGVFRHVNLLVPPKDPRARMGWIIMEPERHAPDVRLQLDLRRDRAAGHRHRSDGRARDPVHAGGPGRPRRGDADAATARPSGSPSATCRRSPTGSTPRWRCGPGHAHGRHGLRRRHLRHRGRRTRSASAQRRRGAELAEPGVRITQAANGNSASATPSNPDWAHFSFCLFAGPRAKGGISAGNAVAIRPGKIDRSPTGTGFWARMALLHARGDGGRRPLPARSIIGSEFLGRIEAETRVGDKPAIVPTITGRGWITGTHQLMLDPDDPGPRATASPTPGRAATEGYLSLTLGSPRYMFTICSIWDDGRGALVG